VKVTATVNNETITLELTDLFLFIRDNRETLITLSRDRWPALLAAVRALRAVERREHLFTCPGCGRETSVIFNGATCPACMERPCDS
jgi:hypothetical protein